MEAVGVPEGLQGRNWGQDVTQTDSLPQQPQSDQGTCPPQHLHGTLLTAALQAHPIHLRERTRDVKAESGKMKHREDGDRDHYSFVDGVDVLCCIIVQIFLKKYNSQK